MKSYSIKLDFHHLVTNDLKNLDINMTETEMQIQTKNSWKLFIFKKIKEHVFTQLVEENSKLKIQMTFY